MTEQSTTQARVFKIGTVSIVEDASLVGRPLEDIKDILKRTYPEVAHATVRERTLEDGTPVVEFLPQPGRKG